MMWDTQQSIARQSGRIVRPLGDHRWLIEDAAGRQMVAYSAEVWPGGSGVVVQNGVIVGRAGLDRAVPVYEV